MHSGNMCVGSRSREHSAFSCSQTDKSYSTLAPHAGESQQWDCMDNKLNHHSTLTFKARLSLFPLQDTSESSGCCLFVYENVCLCGFLHVLSPPPPPPPCPLSHLCRVCREREREQAPLGGDGSRRYGRLHVYPGPDLMSDRERWTVGPGWTSQGAVINLVCVFVCVCVCVWCGCVFAETERQSGFVAIFSFQTVLCTLMLLSVEVYYFHSFEFLGLYLVCVTWVKKEEQAVNTRLRELLVPGQLKMFSSVFSLQHPLGGICTCSAAKCSRMFNSYSP